MFITAIVSVLLLGIRLAVNAFPTVQLRQSAPAGITPPTLEEFSLQMSVDGAYVSLNAVSNGTGDLVLQGGDMSIYPGSPGNYAVLTATLLLSSTNHLGTFLVTRLIHNI